MPIEQRRIVTGQDAEGKSVVVLDGPTSAVLNMGGFRVAQFWVSDGTPADNAVRGDAANRPIRLEPPPNGNNFWYIWIEPLPEAIPAKEIEKAVGALFAQMGAQHCQVDPARNPGMHKTKTLDYIIVLSGKVTLLLDKGEVELNPFDTVVQRGTSHAWINRGPEAVVLAAVVMDAK